MFLSSVSFRGVMFVVHVRPPQRRRKILFISFFFRPKCWTRKRSEPPPNEFSVWRFGSFHGDFSTGCTRIRERKRTISLFFNEQKHAPHSFFPGETSHTPFSPSLLFSSGSAMENPNRELTQMGLPHTFITAIALGQHALSLRNIISFRCFFWSGGVRQDVVQYSLTNSFPPSTMSMERSASVTKETSSHRKVVEIPS